MTNRSVIVLLLIGPLLLVGCGGSSGRSLQVEYVEGVVSLDGQPVSEASIAFLPKNEGNGTEAAGGFSDARGVYKLSSINGDFERGAVAGEYIVTVSKIETNNPFEGMSEEEAEKAAARGLVPTQKELLPTIYQNRRNTPLSFTVNKGRNKIDIELKSNP